MLRTGKLTGKLISWLLVLTYVATSMFVLPQDVYASDMGISYTGGIPSYILPDELLDKMPKLGADPFNIPDPSAGIIPGVPQGGGSGMPQGGSAYGTDSLPDAPGAVMLPQPPPGEDPAKHPVAPATGAVRFEFTDLTLPGNGFGFDLRRSYSSAVLDIGPFGRGWSNNLASFLRMYS